MKKYRIKFAIIGLLAITLSTIVKSSDTKIKLQEIKIIKKLSEKNLEIIHKKNLCNGVNVGLSLLGLGAGLSSGLGFYFKDEVLELMGIVGSMIIPALLITTNCMECCQNPCDKEGYSE